MARYFPGGSRLAFFVLLVAVLAGAWYAVRPVAGALLLGAAVASLAQGANRRLVRLLRGRRRLAAVLEVTVLLLLLLGPLTGLAIVGAARLAVELSALPSQLGRVQAALGQLAGRLGNLGPAVQHAADQLGETITQAVPTIANRVGAWAAALGSALLSGAIGLFLFSISLYYFLVEGVRWRERIIRLLPIEPRHSRALLSRFRNVSLAVLVGNLGTAALHGILSGFGYFLFGVSAPLVWALVTAVASFIPVFGTALVWLPLSVGVVIASGWLAGAGLLAYCAVIVGGADNVVRPFLMRGGLELHPLLVFVAVIGGVEGFGVAGVFLGPLLVALAVSALDIYERDDTGSAGDGGGGARRGEVPRDRSRR